MTGLCVVDVQEKLFGHIFEHEQLRMRMALMLKGAAVLELPVVVSEQYPQGLGKTVLDVVQVQEEKTCFAASYWRSLPHEQWIVMGIETHICVLQTVKRMLEVGKEPIVLADATGSRCRANHDIALDEMRHIGVRVTSIESVLFELLGDAKHPHFKAISQLVK